MVEEASESTANDMTAWHYCSTAAFKGIIENEEFWLSNIFFMNDSGEYRANFDLALKEVDKRQAHDSELNNYYKKLRKLLERDQFEHIYCGCFSKERDDLSQWRGYADGARGVAIKVDLAGVLAGRSEQVEGLAESTSQCLRVSEVTYSESSQRQKLAARIISSREGIPSTVSEDQTVAVTCIWISEIAAAYKHESFSSEKELRLVLSPHQMFLLSSADRVESHRSFTDFWPEETAFRERSGVLVPYVPIEFPKSLIEEVMVGPKFGRQIDRDGLRYFLRCQDIKCDVTTSKSSYM